MPMVTKLSSKSSGAIKLYMNLLATAIYEYVESTRHQIREVPERRVSVVYNFSVRGVKELVMWPPLNLLRRPEQSGRTHGISLCASSHPRVEYRHESSQPGDRAMCLAEITP